MHATVAQETIDTEKKYILQTYGRPDVVFTRGQGTKLYDTEGKEYLDFAAGIAVNALGHNHPKVVEIISKQAGKLIHLSNLYHNEYAQGLAQMIVDSLEKDPKMDKIPNTKTVVESGIGT